MDSGSHGDFGGGSHFDSGSHFDAGSHTQSHHDAASQPASHHDLPSSAPAHHDALHHDSGGAPPAPDGSDAFVWWSLIPGVSPRRRDRSVARGRLRAPADAARPPLLVVALVAAMLFALWLLVR